MALLADSSEYAAHLISAEALADSGFAETAGTGYSIDTYERLSAFWDNETSGLFLIESEERSHDSVVELIETIHGYDTCLP